MAFLAVLSDKVVPIDVEPRKGDCQRNRIADAVR